MPRWTAFWHWTVPVAVRSVVGPGVLPSPGTVRAFALGIKIV